ncbi:MAG: chemoreceptor glutamine deamidase CheD [Pseudomonadota bacterium]
MSFGRQELESTPRTYYDPSFQTEAVKILPGEYYVTTRNTLMVTVLGSCVSACIRDRRLNIAGMNHFMLPDMAKETNDITSNAARYGTYAMEILINQLLKLGARRADLEVKVFGGARVMKGVSAADVGERNSEFVLNYLRLEKLPVIAEDLRDIYPRKIYFFPETGKVLVKKLKSMHNDTIVSRERDYSNRIRVESDCSGDIELFD